MHMINSPRPQAQHQKVVGTRLINSGIFYAEARDDVFLLDTTLDNTKMC